MHELEFAEEAIVSTDLHADRHQLLNHSDCEEIEYCSPITKVLLGSF